MSTPQQEPPEAPPPRRSRVATRLLEQPLRNLGIGVTVLVLGATAAFGGLEPAAARDDVRPVTVGATTRAAPFDITVNRVVWTDSLPNVYPEQEGNRWLAVSATVRNTHDTATTGTELREAVTLGGVPGLVAKPDAAGQVTATYRKVLADSSELYPVQPGLDYTVAFLFEQSGSAAPPTQVTVELVGHTRRRGSIDQSFQWLDATTVARSTLPIRPAAQTRTDASPTVSGSATATTTATVSSAP